MQVLFVCFSFHVEIFLWHCVQVTQVEFSDESWFLDGLDWQRPGRPVPELPRSPADQLHEGPAHLQQPRSEGSRLSPLPLAQQRASDGWPRTKTNCPQVHLPEHQNALQDKGRVEFYFRHLLRRHRAADRDLRGSPRQQRRSRPKVVRAAARRWHPLLHCHRKERFRTSSERSLLCPGIRKGPDGLRPRLKSVLPGVRNDSSRRRKIVRSGKCFCLATKAANIVSAFFDLFLSE